MVRGVPIYKNVLKQNIKLIKQKRERERERIISLVFNNKTIGYNINQQQRRARS